MDGQGILYYEYNCYIETAQGYFCWQDVLFSKRKRYGTVVATPNGVPVLVPANGREYYLDDVNIGFEVYIDDEHISITLLTFNESAEDEFWKQVVAVLARRLVKANKEKQ